MAECVIECYHSTNGNLLTELADFMGKSWKNVRITDGDIVELEKFLAIMSPMKDLFSSLNTDCETNISRVYPTLLNLLGLVDEYANDESSSPYALATELKNELLTTFGYVMDASNQEFDAIFVTATFLDPLFHSIVSSNMTLKEEALKFLSKHVTSGSDEPTPARSTTSIKIKGYGFLSQQISASVMFGRTDEGSPGSKLQQDIDNYLEKAAKFMVRVHKEALDNNGNEGKKINFIFMRFILLFR